MSLEDVIKDLKQQVEEAEKLENSADEDAEDAGGGQDLEATTEEDDAPEEKSSEESKPETVEKAEDTEEKPDSAAYARLRREAAAHKKKADELERRYADLAAAKAKEAEHEGYEHDSREVSPEIAEVLQELKYKKAEREFQSIESDFKRTTPDYDAVAGEYVSALAHSIRMQNPRKDLGWVAEETKRQVLSKAGEYVRQGFNPVEEMYHDAKELGFTGKRSSNAESHAEEKKEEKAKPDMKKVAANRQKSTGMTGSSGRSAGQLTKQAAADMTLAEYQALPAAERQRLLGA
jgi:hypothetical protein